MSILSKDVSSLTKGVALVAALFLLVGCQPKSTVFTCPTLVYYSPIQQMNAANELDRIEQDSPTVTKMIADYGNLRAGLRNACSLRQK